MSLRDIHSNDSHGPTFPYAWDLETRNLDELLSTTSFLSPNKIKMPDMYSRLVEDLLWILQLLPRRRTAALKHALEAALQFTTMLVSDEKHSIDLSRFTRKNWSSVQDLWSEMGDPKYAYTDLFEDHDWATQSIPSPYYYPLELHASSSNHACWYITLEPKDWTYYINTCILGLLRTQVDCSELLQFLFRFGPCTNESYWCAHVSFLMRGIDKRAQLSFGLSADEALCSMDGDQRLRPSILGGMERIYLMAPIQYSNSTSTSMQSSLQHSLHTLFICMLTPAILVPDLASLVLDYALYFRPYLLDQLLQPLELTKPCHTRRYWPDTPLD